MIPDVKINGTSMLSLGWLRETVDFPTPKSQTNTVVVPGRNSPIRFTEALGRVSYQPRSFEITLTMLGTRAEYDSMVSEAVNRYAGQLVQVICSEEPDLYYIGTIEAERNNGVFVQLDLRFPLCEHKQPEHGISHYGKLRLLRSPVVERQHHRQHGRHQDGDRQV